MKKIILLAIGMFALGLDAYVISGIIPAISHSFHATDAQIGQMVTVFTLCYAFSAPVFSTLLTGKSTKQILLIALLFFILANIASALSQNTMELLFARAIAGMSAGLFSPMAASAAASLVEPKYKGRAIGLILGGMGMGTVIGVPLAIYIAYHTSWQNTFWLVSMLGVIAGIGIFYKLPTIETKTIPTLKERVAMLTHHSVAKTIIVTVLMGIASLGLYTYLASVISSTIAVKNIAPYLWVWGIGGMIGSFSIGSLIDLTGNPKRLLLVILLMMTISLLLVPSLLKFSLLGFIPFLFWGASGWSSQAPQQHILLSTHPQHGSIVVALNSSANYLGSSIGAALGGVIISLGIMPSTLPYFAGSVAAVAFIVQFFVVKS